MAAGSNNTMREARGLFGVALLAAAVVALAAVIPALLGPSRARALAEGPSPLVTPEATGAARSGAAH